MADVLKPLQAPTRASSGSGFRRASDAMDCRV